MQSNLTRPCVACPFRTNSLKGWLGDYTPDQIMDDLRNETPFLCHKHIEDNCPDGYDGEWREWAEEHGEVCAGASIFQRKMCKLPRDPELAAAIRKVDISQPILFPRDVFVCHHSDEDNSD